MKEKEINSFSIYAEYMDLFELLPSEEERGQLVWEILKYMFYGEIPILNDNQKRIFNNLKRPLDKSKKKSNKNQNETKIEPNQNQNEIKTETHQDVNVNVNNNVLNEKKDNRVIGKEEKKEEKEKYGEYKNVLLSKKEYESLQNAYSNYEELIKFLDEYIEEKGYKSKSHYLAIRRWVVQAVNENNERNTSQNKQSGNIFLNYAERKGIQL